MAAKGNKYLLDCTLRDGGYLNDWNFGHDNLVSVFERVVDARIDFIEIGFLDDRRPFDINRSIMPDTDSVNKIFGHLDKKNTKVLGMIDYGTCDIKNIKPANDSYLDGIRVIFKKHLREDALSYCKQLIDLGYIVFAQLVSVTSYSDEELLDLIRIANDVKPFAVSMVDTYGLMHQENIMHYFELLDHNLDKNISIGYHAHNNFQMGYANCIAMLSNNVERDLLVDGSLHGMGKSAGNDPIELVAMHMNRAFDKQYDIYQLLEAIDSNIYQFYKPASWGYNMYYFIAALNDCHPNYVGYLMDKKTLSIKSINEILSRLKGEKKLLYDKSYIEKLYLDYQNKDINDEDSFRKLESIMKNKEVLLIGPGPSVNTQCEDIENFVKTNNPIVISLNYISSVKPEYVFITNGKRYVQSATALSLNNYTIIATSNVTPTSNDEFDYVLNYGNLIDLETEIIDNSMVMAIKALMNIGCKKIYLAGFDGYSQNESNYVDEIMEYDFIKQKHEYLNSYNNDFLNATKKKIEIESITNTIYEL